MGSIIDAAGRPFANKAVTLTVGGEKFETLTDRQGQYRFYSAPGGSGALVVDGKTFNVAVGPGNSNSALRLS